MRDLLISVALIALILCGWFYFSHYSKQTVKGFILTIENEAIASVESENWDTSRHAISELEKNWENYKKWALLFLSSKELSEIDYCLARTSEYINAEDVSNSAGELNSVAEQMRFIIEREKVSVENIL